MNHDDRVNANNPPRASISTFNDPEKEITSFSLKKEKSEPGKNLNFSAQDVTSNKPSSMKK